MADEDFSGTGMDQDEPDACVVEDLSACTDVTVGDVEACADATMDTVMAEMAAIKAMTCEAAMSGMDDGMVMVETPQPAACTAMEEGCPTVGWLGNDDGDYDYDGTPPPGDSNDMDDDGDGGTDDGEGSDDGAEPEPVPAG